MQSWVHGCIISFCSAMGPVRKIHKFHHSILRALGWRWGGADNNPLRWIYPLPRSHKQILQMPVMKWHIPGKSPRIQKICSIRHMGNIKAPTFMTPISFMWQQTWGFVATCGFPGSGLASTSQNLQHVQPHVCLSKCFETLLRDKGWGRGFRVVLLSEEGIIANRKKRCFFFV